MRGLSRSLVKLALATTGAVIALALLTPRPALASHDQIAIIQDDPNVLSNPGRTITEMRHLGAQMLRVTVEWSSIAPAADSRHRPSFDAADPSAYPARGWARYDTLVRDATAAGMEVLFVPSGFAPLWAQGSDPGRYGAHNNNPNQAFEPSAGQYELFVQALGTRYSGTFTPQHDSSPLPRVSYWELYNEPNFGEDIAPQAIDGSQVLYAPTAYRALAAAAWRALQTTGHGGDTILIGALAARGSQEAPSPGKPQGLPGTYGETKPLAFVRALYCLDDYYRPYRGPAAAVRGCPTTAAGMRRFRAQNPALFQASGFSVHPYPGISAPNVADSQDPSYAEFSELNRLGATLDRIQRIYDSSKRFPIWNTEFGYITDPPNRGVPSGYRQGHYLSPATAAYYINWAEYLSWRNPRIVSTAQYLLYDPDPAVGQAEYGGFSSGLVFYRTVDGGAPKATYNAYRLPIFLPATVAGAGRTLEVWGAARPAPYAAQDTGAPQYVQIQWARGSGAAWKTMKVVQINAPNGYFDARVAFPASGQVRLAWAYPPTDLALSSSLVTGYAEPLGAITSRTVQVTIR